MRMLTNTSEQLPKIYERNLRLVIFMSNVNYVKYVGLCSLVQTFACLLLSYTSFMGLNFTPDVRLKRTSRSLRRAHVRL